MASTSNRFPDVEFVRADAASLPFASGAFEAVTARHVLSLVPDPRRALEEFRRVSRSEGRFLVTERRRHGPWSVSKRVAIITAGRA